MLNNPLADIPMFFGLIIICAALFLLVLPPKEPNLFYGYRTRRAMKSKDHWRFAQKTAAKILLLSGLASMAFSSVGWILDLEKGLATTIGIAWIVVVSIALIIRVERALIQEFGE